MDNKGLITECIVMVLGITKSSNGIHGDKEGRSAIKNKCYYFHLASFLLSIMMMIASKVNSMDSM